AKLHAYQVPCWRICARRVRGKLTRFCMSSRSSLKPSTGSALSVAFLKGNAAFALLRMGNSLLSHFSFHLAVDKLQVSKLAPPNSFMHTTLVDHAIVYIIIAQLPIRHLTVLDVLNCPSSEFSGQRAG